MPSAVYSVNPTGEEPIVMTPVQLLSPNGTQTKEKEHPEAWVEMNNQLNREDRLEVITDMAIQERDPMHMCTSSNRSIIEELAQEDCTRKVKWALRGLAFVLYHSFLGYAVYKTWDVSPSWCDGVKLLVALTILVYFSVIYSYVVRTWLQKAANALSANEKFMTVSRNKYTRWAWWISVLAAIITFLIIDTAGNRLRLISTSGIVILLIAGYALSTHRRKVVWHQVACGLFLQFLFGLIVLRWSFGREVFRCLGNKVETFLGFTVHGSSFVFGYLSTGELKDAPLQTPVYAFRHLITILFFGFVVAILYYYGVMQVFVAKVGWILHATMGTTACESMNAAANIFLGLADAPFVIRPYIHMMTKSELHAVMAGGFSTTAGSLMAAYISLGVSPSHLLSASVMSAPAALAVSKLIWPETEESRTRWEDIKLEKGKEQNVIEAACQGATSAVGTIAGIIANIVPFMAFIYFINSVVAWLGTIVGLSYISLTWIISKMFMPLAFVMGVPWDETDKIGELLGYKTVIHEFVGYNMLINLQKTRAISSRAETIAVYALCGLSSIPYIGIEMGSLTAMAPQRKSDLAAVVVRALIAGNLASYMTACVAGMLLNESNVPPIGVS